MKNHWTIKDPHDVKTSELIKKARKMFKKVYLYDKKNIDKQFPAPKKTLTVSFRKSYEPDKEHLGKSYDDFMAEKDKKWMTLRQYLILSMKVWKEEGKHLDVIGWTRTCDLWTDGYLVCGDWHVSFSLLHLGYGSRARRDSASGPREQLNLESSNMTKEITTEFMSAEGYNQALEDIIKILKEKIKS